MRWDAVAAWSSRTAHALAQWDYLSARAAPCSAPCPYVAAPDTGGLPPSALRTLLGVLLGHTSTPGRGFVAVWEGYGWIPSGDEGLRVLDLDQRSFWVREGPIANALEVGWRTDSAGPLRPEPPTLIWPADRAWFVAGDVDLDSTYVGGSEALVRDLLGNPGLEGWAVDPADGISVHSDAVNGPGPHTSLLSASVATTIEAITDCSAPRHGDG